LETESSTLASVTMGCFSHSETQLWLFAVTFRLQFHFDPGVFALVECFVSLKRSLNGSRFVSTCRGLTRRDCAIRISSGFPW